jgi:hypothetical protein
LQRHISGLVTRFRTARVTIQAAVITAIAVIIAAVLPQSLALVGSLLHGSTQVEIVDVLVADRLNHVILDLKVANRGSRTAFLKRARIDILAKETAAEFCCPKPVTRNYTVNLEGAAAAPISHSVPAGGVERFQVTVIAQGDPGGATRYKIRPVVEFDKTGAAAGPVFFISLSGVRPGVVSHIEKLPENREPSFEKGWRDPTNQPEGSDPVDWLLPRERS